MLNEAWLEKYFQVEPRDVVQLGDPETHILSKGGYVYHAQMDNGSIVGVAALMYVSEGVYELSKMAVDESHQGNGIGRILAVKCLNKAREINARKVTLYTNSVLVRAIQLYHHLGFREVDLDPGQYERADTKMELNLMAENIEA